MGASVRRGVSVAVGLLVAMAVGLGVAWAQQAGITSVSPDSPYPGDTITVTGNEFHANATIELRWGDRDGPVIGSTMADESGAFSAEGTIPADAEPGERLVVAKDPDVETPGHGEASVMVNVASEESEPTPEPETGTGPQVAVVPETVSAGAQVKMTGAGFDPEGEPVGLHWDETGGPLLGLASVGEDGGFARTVGVPGDAGLGEHQVVALQQREEQDPFQAAAAITVEASQSEPAGLCPEQVEPAGFADREAIAGAHLDNVDCAAGLGIVQGFAADGTYRPTVPVRRDQMATFVAGMLDAAGVPLPDPGQSRFDDMAGSAHEDAVARLAAAGIVRGGPAGESPDSYGPALKVRRDQMASFLLRSVEYTLDRDLGSERQAFGDVPPNNPHWSNVNGAADLDLVQGFVGGTYRPATDVRRDQMASFVVRVLHKLADQSTDGETGEDPTGAPLE